MSEKQSRKIRQEVRKKIPEYLRDIVKHSNFFERLSCAWRIVIKQV